MSHLKPSELTDPQPKRDFQAILKYARICRVENVIRPYLEATQ